MNYDFWKDAWGVVSSAPVIVIGIAICCMAVAWWFRGVVEGSEKSGLRATLEVLQERVQLAKDGEAAVRKKLDVAEIKAKFLDQEIARTGASSVVVATSSASVIRSIQEASSADVVLHNAISAFEFDSSRDVVRSVLLTIFLRPILWILVAAVAAIPAMQGVAYPTIDLIKSANSSGQFRDLFYMIIPTVALALSSSLDCLSASRGKLSFFNFIIIVIGLIGILASLSGALVGLLTIPPSHLILPPDKLQLYSRLLINSLLISLVVDLSTSLTAEMRRIRS